MLNQALEDIQMSQLGTDASELISATQNTVYALDGDDQVFTGLAGNVRLYGGEGNDFLQNNGDAVAFLYGGGGNDTLSGGTQGDQIFGDDGNDFLVGVEIDNARFNVNGTI